MSWKQKCTHRSGGCYQFQHVLYQACYLQMCKDLLADNRVNWSCCLTWAHYSSVSYWLVNAFYFSTPNALFWFLLPECPSELSRSYLDTLVEGDSMAWQEGNLQVCSSFTLHASFVVPHSAWWEIVRLFSFYYQKWS